ncbi:RAB6A-GEF complex partner protein 2-like isoform X2 [Ostrea edulis]|uniref:RAB6A-GEF complex partner protein 2-like isoform X2 n=1 Tax=Ostrea edulis TaxID=37623 RepID=UPI0024AFED81|nr:RAB6A-GEF complex partner protein 2-like isoform X2 [Ostrea edulis]XP_055995309.1 RAB6A-GEF complex partner protein 2-like isoform X2 [Ostrea edulis]
MIEVSGFLPRGSVYLAGETVKCIVTITNLSKQSQNNVDCLAWASVQINCQCSVSDTRINLPYTRKLSSEEISPSSSDTSFVPNRGEQGMTVLSTKPRILFCDLKLRPGESKSFAFEDVIPADAPPSYRGQAIKYSYKLTIGAQMLDHPTKLLRLPFRVLVLHDFYNITNAKGKVAKFTLFKQAYKLGEDIVGMFDFSEGTVPCVQFSVTLQSEEQIAEECRRKVGHGSSCTSYVKHQDMCLHTQKTHINVPVPLSVTPGFMTDIVCLRWRLHFEFVTSCDQIPELETPERPDASAVWSGPSNLNVETMIWDLPIKIYPTNPLHACSSTQLKTYTSITL